MMRTTAAAILVLMAAAPAPAIADGKTPAGNHSSTACVQAPCAIDPFCIVDCELESVVPQERFVGDPVPYIKASETSWTPPGYPGPDGVIFPDDPACDGLPIFRRFWCLVGAAD